MKTPRRKQEYLRDIDRWDPREIARAYGIEEKDVWPRTEEEFPEEHFLPLARSFEFLQAYLTHPLADAHELGNVSDVPDDLAAEWLGHLKSGVLIGAFADDDPQLDAFCAEYLRQPHIQVKELKQRICVRLAPDSMGETTVRDLIARVRSGKNLRKRGHSRLLKCGIHALFHDYAAMHQVPEAKAAAVIWAYLFGEALGMDRL